jgi:hypothetical protein
MNVRTYYAACQFVLQESTKGIWHYIHKRLVDIMGPMRKRLMIIGVLFLGLMLAIVLVQSLSKHVADQAFRSPSDKFVGYILAGDGDSSYDLYAKQARSSLDYIGWASQVATLHNFFGEVKASYAGDKVTQSASKNSKDPTELHTLTYKVPSSKGTYTFSVIMTKDSDNWRVLGFASKAQGQK